MKFTPVGQAPRTVVQDIIHNEKGQRKTIRYGNNTRTSYTYNEKNYRVTRILTENLSNSKFVQDLRYFYDAVGNITTVKDDADQTVFFNNCMILPKQEFTYDALYRLIEAKGREKIGIANMGNKDCWDNTPWMNEMMPGADWNATQNYTQTYNYDAAGNMLMLKHIAPTASYTRDFIINTNNNQLVQTEIGSDIYPHTYDALGNMTTMSHLNSLDYNWQNSLAHIQRGTDDAYYQ